MPRYGHGFDDETRWPRRLRIPTALAVTIVGSSTSLAITFAGCHVSPHIPVDARATSDSYLTSNDTPDPMIDTRVDMLVDAKPDARPDARPDAPPDASPDAPPDAAIDAAIDAPPDTPIV